MRRQHLLAAVGMSIILLPWIPIAPGLPALRPEWILVFLGAFFFPLLKRAVFGPATTWAVSAILAYLLSGIYGSYFLGLSSDLRDLTEILKPVLYLIFFVVTASGNFKTSEAFMILRTIIICLFISSTITIIQYFEPSSIRALLLLYRPDPNELENYRNFRAWGTMGNPNDMGFLGAVGSGLSLFTLRHKLFPYWIATMFLTISSLAVVLTGSRTGMVCLAAVAVVFVALELKRNARSIFVTAAVVAALVWIFETYMLETVLSANSVERVMSLGDIRNDAGGWIARVENTLPVLREVYESPIIGHGASKGTFLLLSNIDNEYLIILYRFGVVGLITTVGFLWAVITCSRRQVNQAPFIMSMKNLTSALVVAAAIFAFTAGVYGQFQIMSLLILLFVLPTRIRSSERQVSVH